MSARSAGALATLVTLVLAAGCASTTSGAPGAGAGSTTSSPSASTSSAGTSSAGTPSAGTPSAGTPSAGTTATGSAAGKALPTGPAPLPKVAAVSVTSVTIASIDVRTGRLEELGTDDDGVLEAPKNPDRAGWYAAGSVPGETGPAVIAGHVDSTTGPAVFYDLKRVSRGDSIEVGLSDGTRTTFVVDRVVTTPKDGFPTDEVFGPTPDAELRLITCGGPYDRTVGAYVDNTVVFATVRTTGA